MLVVQIVGLGLIGLGVLLLVKKVIGTESDLQIPGITVKAPASVLILVIGVLVFLFPYSPWWPGSAGGTAGTTPSPSTGPDIGGVVSTKSPASPALAAAIGDYRGSTPAAAKAALAALCSPFPCVSVIFAPSSGDGLLFRQVVRTEPAQGQIPQPGGTVVVYVSTGGQPTDGSWYELQEGEYFSIAANNHGWSPWRDLIPFNPGIDYDHVQAGDLMWLPARH